MCCVTANNSQDDLSLEEKLAIVENLDSDSIKIDVSGGDPLIEAENINVIKALSSKLGRLNISITSTGKGLENVSLSELSNYTSEIGFTYDFSDKFSTHRPDEYNEHNLSLAKRVSQKGIPTIAQTPLIKVNIGEEIINGIYTNLYLAGIDKLLLMRFLESGKGSSRKDLLINQKEINSAIRFYRELEREYGQPIIKVAPFARGNLIGNIFTSLNISSQGFLLSSPWAYEPNGEPKDYSIIGDLKTNRLSDLFGKGIVQRFVNQLKYNLGR